MGNIGQFMRDNWLSSRVFKSCDDLIEHCSEAWNKLADQLWADHAHWTVEMTTWVLINRKPIKLSSCPFASSLVLLFSLMRDQSMGSPWAATWPDLDRAYFQHLRDE